jgi:hypothetical protein
MVHPLIRSPNPVGKRTGICKGDLVTNTETVHILPDFRDSTGSVEAESLVIAGDRTARDLNVLDIC